MTVYEPCGPGTATHYFHARENVVLPVAEYEERHSGDCVLWLTQSFVTV